MFITTLKGLKLVHSPLTTVVLKPMRCLSAMNINNLESDETAGVMHRGAERGEPPPLCCHIVLKQTPQETQ